MIAPPTKILTDHRPELASTGKPFVLKHCIFRPNRKAIQHAPPPSIRTRKTPFVLVLLCAGDQTNNVGQANSVRSQGAPDEYERCRPAQQGAVSECLRVYYTEGQHQDVVCAYRAARVWLQWLHEGSVFFDFACFRHVVAMPPDSAP